MAARECGSGPVLNRRCLLSGACLAVVAIVIGCRATERLEVSQAGAPQFERFRAEYVFEQPGQLLGRSFGARSDSESAAGSGIRTVAAETCWSDAQLRIECPHPDGDVTRALVTLTLSERRGATAVVREEVRQLSIWRSQVELLISDLARRGFFDEPSGDADNARLAIRIDRGEVHRRWSNDARLLDLAHQTLTDGSVAAD